MLSSTSHLNFTMSEENGNREREGSFRCVFFPSQQHQLKKPPSKKANNYLINFILKMERCSDPRNSHRSFRLS